MKNIFSFLTISFLATLTLLGQDENQRQLEVRIMVPDISAALNIGLEYMPNKRFGAEVSTGIRIADSYVFSHFNENGGETDFFVIIKSKFYLLPRHGADRVYIGPYGLYEHNKNIISLDQETFENRILMGGLLGYKFLLGRRVAIDFVAGSGFGRQLNKVQSVEEIRTLSQEKLNFYILGSLNIGFRF